MSSLVSAGLLSLSLCVSVVCLSAAAAAAALGSPSASPLAHTDQTTKRHRELCNVAFLLSVCVLLAGVSSCVRLARFLFFLFASLSLCLLLLLLLAATPPW